MRAHAMFYPYLIVVMDHAVLSSKAITYIRNRTFHYQNKFASKFAIIICLFDVSQLNLLPLQPGVKLQDQFLLLLVSWSLLFAFCLSSFTA